MKNWLYSSLILLFIIGCSQPQENEEKPSASEGSINVQQEVPTVENEAEEVPSKALEPKDVEVKEVGEKVPYHNAPEQDEIDRKKAQKQKGKQ